MTAQTPYQNPEPPQKSKKRIPPLLISLGSAVLAWSLFSLAALFWFKWNYLQTETAFTSERIAELSAQVYFPLDQVKVEKYRTTTAAGDVCDELWISGIADPAALMEENTGCPYTLLGEQTEVGSDRRSYSGSSSEICATQYRYEPDTANPYQQTDCIISFFAADDGSYCAKIYVSKW